MHGLALAALVLAAAGCFAPREPTWIDPVIHCAGPAVANVAPNTVYAQRNGVNGDGPRWCLWPDALHVHRGDNVTFVNVDNTGHPILVQLWGAQGDQVLAAGAEGSGQPLTYTFTETGHFEVYCSSHGGFDTEPYGMAMSGGIWVE